MGPILLTRGNQLAQRALLVNVLVMFSSASMKMMTRSFRERMAELMLAVGAMRFAPAAGASLRGRHARLVPEPKEKGSVCSQRNPEPLAGPAGSCIGGLCSGARVATSKGQVPVENLKAGDRLLVTSGDFRQLLAIRRIDVDGTHPVDGSAAVPVTILAGAFASGQPSRDLCLSPDHSVRVAPDDQSTYLIRTLLNGSTIRQQNVDAATYWCLDVEGDEDLVVEGLQVPAGCAASGQVFGGSELGTAEERRKKARSQLRARAFALGWALGQAPGAALALEVDGAILDPDVERDKFRFVLPESARDVWLISDVTVPSHVDDLEDDRPLGACLRHILVEDGLSVSRVTTMDDPRFRIGFHGVEEMGEHRCRWTDGRAKLPPSLWEGCRGTFFLQIDVIAIPERWIEPRKTEAAVLARRSSEGRQKNRTLFQILISDGEATGLADNPSLVANRAALAEHHPDLAYELMRPAEIESFLAAHFGADVMQAYRTIVPYAFKADLVRYCLLLACGGLYADLSMRLMGPILLPSGRKVVCFRDIPHDGRGLWTVSNGLIYALAGRNELRLAIEMIVQNVNDRHYGATCLHPTGPALLGRAMAVANREEDLFVGEFKCLSSNNNPFNLGYTDGYGRLVAVRMKNIGGDLSHLGLIGTNNYAELWQSRRIYGESATC